MMSKYTIITTLMMLTLLVACERKIDSTDPVRSVPTFTVVPTPVNLLTVVDDGTVTLSWELTDSSDAAMFRVYVAESEDGEYYLYDSTAAFSIIMSDLLLDQQSFLCVATVTADNVESQLSLAESVTATHFSININDNSEYTNLRDVQVRFISGVSALYVQIAEQQDFVDAIWESFDASISFELSENDGVKTVYARLQFADGSETGQLLSDEIMLDTYADIDTLLFFPPPESDLMVEGDEATFRMYAEESGGEASVSFGSEYNVVLFDDGTNGDALANDGVYTNRYTVPYGVYAFNEVITGSFVDIAGNRADDVTTEKRMYISSPLEPVTLAVSNGVSDSTIVFTWTISNEIGFESYRLMKVEQSGSDDVLMIATESSTNRFEMFKPLVSSEYYINLFDHHGESAASNTVLYTP